MRTRFVLSALLLAFAVFLSCWPTPSHAGIAIPGAQYVHKTNFNFGLGVDQHYASPTADLITKVVPTTIASARVGYALFTNWKIEGQIGREVQSNAFKVSEAGDWHARVGLWWSFSP